jgi:hypothetical protein
MTILVRTITMHRELGRTSDLALLLYNGRVGNRKDAFGPSCKVGPPPIVSRGADDVSPHEWRSVEFSAQRWHSTGQASKFETGFFG